MSRRDGEIPNIHESTAATTESPTTADKLEVMAHRMTDAEPVCGTKWQNADEKPSSKGVPVNLRRDDG
jgi:hypothetical protein